MELSSAEFGFERLSREITTPPAPGHDPPGAARLGKKSSTEKIAPAGFAVSAWTTLGGSGFSPKNSQTRTTMRREPHDSHLHWHRSDMLHRRVGTGGWVRPARELDRMIGLKYRKPCAG